VVEGRPKICMSKGILKREILQDGLTVGRLHRHVGAGEPVPDRSKVLDAFDAVVLAMWAAQFMSAKCNPRHLRSRSWRRFILAGGENNYGEGGYPKRSRRSSAVISRPRREPDSVSMIVVLDKSGSRAAEIELQGSHESALALLRTEDSFGVVAFDFQLLLAVRLQSVTTESDQQAISTIIAGRETNIIPRSARLTFSSPAPTTQASMSFFCRTALAPRRILKV